MPKEIQAVIDALRAIVMDAEPCSEENYSGKWDVNPDLIRQAREAIKHLDNL